MALSSKEIRTPERSPAAPPNSFHSALARIHTTRLVGSTEITLPSESTSSTTASRLSGRISSDARWAGR